MGFKENKLIETNENQTHSTMYLNLVHMYRDYITNNREYVYIQILLEGLHGIPALLFLDEAPLPLDFVLFLFDILIFFL